jgi:hypothetical protein
MIQLALLLIALQDVNKAKDYVRANYKQSRIAGHVFAGFMFLMDGQSGAELADCVSYCCKAIRQKGSMENWHTGMSLYFLSEVYLRTPTAEIQAALVEGMRLAAERIEPETGGWCHEKEYWKKDGYNKRGGGKDIGILTCMYYAAFLEMKSFGIDPGPTMERARKNLESISDGFGFRYGTDNKVPDRCLSHGAFVLLGIRGAGLSEHPFMPKIIEGLSQRYTKCFESHAFAPLHYFAVGAAMHRMGQYAKFAECYLGKFQQLKDGSVPMKSDSGRRPDTDKQMDSVASTAVFACLVMMQKEGVFMPKGKKK